MAQRQCISLVASSLVSYGIDHFIPKIETVNVVRGRHVREQRPIFGDYILTTVTSAWKELCYVRGVAGWLLDAVSGMPAQVLSHEMERIRDNCNEEWVYTSKTGINPSQFFLEYGDKVKPTSGFFSQQVGRYEGKTKRGETALFLLFGKDTRVEFKEGELVCVEKTR